MREIGQRMGHWHRSLVYVLLKTKNTALRSEAVTKRGRFICCNCQTKKKDKSTKFQELEIGNEEKLIESTEHMETHSKWEQYDHQRETEDINIHRR